MLAEDRQKLAMEAAIEVAAWFVIRPQNPRILKDSNNTIIHLAPAPLVAKVGTSTIRVWDATTLER